MEQLKKQSINVLKSLLKTKNIEFNVIKDYIELNENLNLIIFPDKNTNYNSWNEEEKQVFKLLTTSVIYNYYVKDKTECSEFQDLFLNVDFFNFLIEKYNLDNLKTKVDFLDNESFFETYIKGSEEFNYKDITLDLLKLFKEEQLLLDNQKILNKSYNYNCNKTINFIINNNLNIEKSISFFKNCNFDINFFNFAMKQLGSDFKIKDHEDNDITLWQYYIKKYNHNKSISEILNNWVIKNIPNEKSYIQKVVVNSYFKSLNRLFKSSTKQSIKEAVHSQQNWMDLVNDDGDTVFLNLSRRNIDSLNLFKAQKYFDYLIKTDNDGYSAIDYYFKNNIENNNSYKLETIFNYKNLSSYNKNNEGYLHFILDNFTLKKLNDFIPNEEGFKFLFGDEKSQERLIEKILDKTLSNFKFTSLLNYGKYIENKKLKSLFIILDHYNSLFKFSKDFYININISELNENELNKMNEKINNMKIYEQYELKNKYNILKNSREKFLKNIAKIEKIEELPEFKKGFNDLIKKIRELENKDFFKPNKPLDFDFDILKIDNIINNLEKKHILKEINLDASKIKNKRKI